MPAAAQSKVAPLPPARSLEASHTTNIPRSVSTVVIHEDVTVPNGVKLGDFVTIGRGTVLGAEVIIASNVVIGDLYGIYRKPLLLVLLVEFYEYM